MRGCPIVTVVNHLPLDEAVVALLLRNSMIQTDPIVAAYIYPLLARLYESTGRAIAVTPASALALASASALLKMLKFLVKVFMSLYL